MKPALLDILVCPACQNALDLRADVRKELEVLEGALRCMGCARDYPIVSGVPRFVGSAAYASSFGRQWHWFRKVQIDSMSGTDESERMLAATTGWSGEDYRGQLVLDAGVGAGRFAEIVSNKGGDVVGVDLSQAIDAAYENIGSRPNVHLVQADILAMPFRDGTFDMAYSVGVLHHTPDPAAAFARVAAAVRQGGALAVYLYARYGPSHRFSDMIRVLTTRLPLPVLRAAERAGGPGVLPVSRALAREGARRWCARSRFIGTGGGGGSTRSTGTRRVTSGSSSIRRSSAGSGPMASATSSCSTAPSACAA